MNLNDSCFCTLRVSIRFALLYMVRTFATRISINHAFCLLKATVALVASFVVAHDPEPQPLVRRQYSRPWASVTEIDVAKPNVYSAGQSGRSVLLCRAMRFPLTHIGVAQQLLTLLGASFDTIIVETWIYVS